jgi:hypothetical protein
VHLDPNQRYQVTHCLERFGIPIRNLDVELIFQRHDCLDHIEAGARSASRLAASEMLSGLARSRVTSTVLMRSAISSLPTILAVSTLVAAYKEHCQRAAATSQRLGC